ncbi:MAG: histidinol-phosphate aminotransferase family protein [Methanomicrobiales archaeon]|nr:histidinol-phosphate aminotransferase family protein [Methanomicrobiales archaeon]
MDTQRIHNIKPRSHLREIHRTPPERFDRTAFLRLDKNEGIPGIPQETVEEILSTVTPDLISSYPQVYPLYERLTSYLSLSEDHILITAGSDAAIKNVFEVFLRPGDGVIIPEPTYAMYEIYTRLFQGNLTKVPFSSDLALPPDQILDAVTSKTRLIALPNPNSPTGTVIPQRELEEIIRQAGESGVLVLIDEAYYPYYPKTAVSWVNSHPNLIVTRTFSKAFGLASLRVGYAVGDPELISSMKKFRPIYETNGLAILFASYLLDHPGILDENIRRVNEGRDYLSRAAAQLGLITYPTHANFINIRVGISSVLPLQRFLEREGILVKAGYEHPALRDCIRITLGGVNEMKRVIEKIQDFLGKHRDRMPDHG